MSRRATLVFAIVVGLYAIYDFWRGYHETKSITAGVVAIVLSLIGWGFYVWLFFANRNSN